MKNILILSTSYGQGHMATARAMKDAIDSNSGGKVNVEIIDLTETISSILNKTSKRAYEDTTKYAPFLYKLFFDTTDYKTPVKAFNEINYQLNKEKILNLFKSKAPGLIVCNSPHWQYIVSLAVQDEPKNIPVVSVITDSITLHASWAVGNSDYYIVPNTETAHSLERLEIPKDRILALGYPIGNKFNQEKFNKSKFLKDNSLDGSKKTILYIATSARTSYVLELIEKISNKEVDAQLIVITGRDSQLYKNLGKADLSKSVLVLEWTDNMANFILSADVVITKAGGSTVMECIGVGKPVIINKVIPGQEEGNAEYVLKHKLGLIADDPSEVVKAIRHIFSNLDIYNKKLSKTKDLEASDRIASFLLKLL